MREIKFRAFADFGKFSVMIDEVSVHAASNYIGTHHEAFEGILESTDWKMNDNFQFENKKTGETIDFHSVKVYPGDDYLFFEGQTLMQFTGLKDKNNKPIYEGDVVVSSDMYGVYSGVVEWWYDRWVLSYKGERDGSKQYKSLMTVSTPSIIGNIYQHKHLSND